MTNDNLTLADLGWSPFYQSQLSLEDVASLQPLRVTEVHRNAMDTLGPDGPARIPMTGDFADHGIAVGDWILIDKATGHPEKVLDRKSLLQRRAAGNEPSAQLIAANIDTLFITSSCNADFNPARLERYLALALQASVDPVIVLTKADLTEDADDYRRRAEAIMRGVLVEVIDAKSDAVTTRLAPFCAKGRTVALLGSSGVGKSTLTNALTGEHAATQAIREDDAKGRHTTTARSMHRTDAGGWLIDTPGIRELRLFDVGEGLDEVFEDIVDLAVSCRFKDCAHDAEPGCAVQAAIAAGTLDAERLRRWQKLLREDLHNTESVAEHRARARGTQKLYRQGKLRGKSKRGDPA
jgi:ribosome biogenesis GTPase